MPCNPCHCASAQPGPLPLPLVGFTGSAGRRRGGRFAAEERWENEGGQVSGRDRAWRQVGVRVPPVSERDRLMAEVDIAARTLLDDFASGRVGVHYNTYAHRSRVLRQLKARIHAMTRGEGHRS